MSNQINGKSVDSLIEKIKGNIESRNKELEKLSKILDFLERCMRALSDTKHIVKITKISNKESYDIVNVNELSGSVFMEKYGMLYFSGEVFSFRNGEFSYSRNKSVGIDLDKRDDYKFEVTEHSDYKRMIADLVDKMV